MIPRLKRQTKKRHSVRAERFVTFRNVKFNRVTMSVPWDGSGPMTMTIECDALPIIGAPLTPDVWTP